MLWLLMAMIGRCGSGRDKSFSGPLLVPLPVSKLSLLRVASAGPVSSGGGSIAPGVLTSRSKKAMNSRARLSNKTKKVFQFKSVYLLYLSILLKKEKCLISYYQLFIIHCIHYNNNVSFLNSHRFSYNVIL